jgi:hypothetical protein
MHRASCGFGVLGGCLLSSSDGFRISVGLKWIGVHRQAIGSVHNSVATNK